MSKRTMTEQIQIDTIDIGSIRTQIINIVNWHYDVKEVFDSLMINDQVEINLSDSLIKELIVGQGMTVLDIANDVVIAQYNYLMDTFV